MGARWTAVVWAWAVSLGLWSSLGVAEAQEPRRLRVLVPPWAPLNVGGQPNNPSASNLTQAIQVALDDEVTLVEVDPGSIDMLTGCEFRSMERCAMLAGQAVGADVVVWGIAKVGFGMPPQTRSTMIVVDVRRGLTLDWHRESGIKVQGAVVDRVFEDLDLVLSGQAAMRMPIDGEEALDRRAVDDVLAAGALERPEPVLAPPATSRRRSGGRGGSGGGARAAGGSGGGGRPADDGRGRGGHVLVSLAGLGGFGSYGTRHDTRYATIDGRPADELTLDDMAAETVLLAQGDAAAGGYHLELGYGVLPWMDLSLHAGGLHSLLESRTQREVLDEAPEDLAPLDVFPTRGSWFVGAMLGVAPLPRSPVRPTIQGGVTVLTGPRLLSAITPPTVLQLTNQVRANRRLLVRLQPGVEVHVGRTPLVLFLRGDAGIPVVGRTVQVFDRGAVDRLSSRPDPFTSRRVLLGGLLGLAVHVDARPARRR